MPDLPPPTAPLVLEQSAARWLGEGAPDEGTEPGFYGAARVNSDPSWGGLQTGVGTELELGLRLDGAWSGERVDAWTQLDALGDMHTVAGLAGQASALGGAGLRLGGWRVGADLGLLGDAWRVGHPLPMDLGVASSEGRLVVERRDEALYASASLSAWRGSIWSHEGGAWVDEFAGEELELRVGRSFDRIRLGAYGTAAQVRRDGRPWSELVPASNDAAWARAGAEGGLRFGPRVELEGYAGAVGLATEHERDVKGEYALALLGRGERAGFALRSSLRSSSPWYASTERSWEPAGVEWQFRTPLGWVVQSGYGLTTRTWTGARGGGLHGSTTEVWRRAAVGVEAERGRMLLEAGMAVRPATFAVVSPTAYRAAWVGVRFEAGGAEWTGLANWPVGYEPVRPLKLAR